MFEIIAKTPIFLNEGSRMEYTDFNMNVDLPLQIYHRYQNIHIPILVTRTVVKKPTTQGKSTKCFSSSEHQALLKHHLKPSFIHI